MHDTTAQIEMRIERFVRERVAPAVERRHIALDVTAWEVPDEPAPFAEGAAVVVEAVKLAEDRSGDLVVRLYEARGGRARARVEVSEPYARAWTTDLLEREPATVGNSAVRSASWDAGEPVDITFRPFEIVTLRVRRA
ncbi:glycosyl hydrolase-related protein [Streptomyces luomodiensis]|uniref:glycosyl hydrolase-related protein n=1 Tax=Streptomyces luomodiensis TaxID=3026192 RepID=UPI00287B6C80|nr:glycosyl hydrolase-related protein [Streptomyces sp. SCA4-21]